MLLFLSSSFSITCKNYLREQKASNLFKADQAHLFSDENRIVT